MFHWKRQGIQDTIRTQKKCLQDVYVELGKLVRARHQSVLNTTALLASSNEKIHAVVKNMPIFPTQPKESNVQLIIHVVITIMTTHGVTNNREGGTTVVPVLVGTTTPKCTTGVRQVTSGITAK